MDDAFAETLRRFADGLARDGEGRARAAHEREALIAATREMLGRLGRDAAGAFAEGAVLRPGQIIGGVFALVGFVDRGGVAEVYRARHAELGTDHAVKVLRADRAADPHAAALLLNEARLLTRVRHEAVVAGQALLRDAEGRPALVMEYLRGPSLARVLRAGPAEPAAVARLGRRLAAALAATHARGIVHQDVSPENIILCDEDFGAAALIDFGLARALGDWRNPHAGIDFAGKLSWVAPERLRPGAPADARSDLYSLGLVLAAAATGRRPFTAADEAGAVAERARGVALDGVPKGLRAVLRRLLQIDPDRRPRSAYEVDDLLREAGRRRWG